MCKDSFRAKNQFNWWTYVPNFIWNDREVKELIDLSTYPFTGVDVLRAEIPLDAEAIDYFSKCFTDEATDIICKETNRYAEQYIEANAANLRPNQLFMITDLQIGMK